MRGGTWRRLGRIFEPPGDLGWMQSHAALPVPDVRPECLRVFFSGRDSRGRATLGSFDYDLEAGRVLCISEQPVLVPGALGTFDDSGITASCLIRDEGREYHYYSGWTLGVTVPFYFYAGLALRETGETQARPIFPAPILARSAVDPYLTASPFVLREADRWRMWYVSGTGWDPGPEGGAPKHYYHLKYAESDDGIEWRREGRIAIDYAGPAEYAIARPWVVRDADCYRMWFCARGERYLLGYAESPDGLVWHRDDRRAGLQPAEEGWDSEMLAYPAVFDANGRRYMLYNGNGYGRSGIGLARWEPD